MNASGSVIEGTQNVADKFSANTASGGNGQLTYPVGLMTADEVWYAAGNVGSYNNPSVYYYLNSEGTSVTGSTYWWTATPVYWYYSFAGVFNLYGSYDPGSLDSGVVSNSDAVRPVVSLKSCVTYLKGDGKPDNPYEVSIDESCKLAVN